MHPRQLRVGDLVDDYCPRERRLSNHAIVALVGDDIRQVRCTTCDAEHEYKGGKVPVSRRKKPVAGPPALAPTREAAALAPAEAVQAGDGQQAPGAIAAAPAEGAAREQAAPEAGATEPEAPSPHAEISLHRRLIRATLPRIESDAPARPIPEFTMHRAAPAGHGQRHGKPFRYGQGGGQPRHGAKGGFGQGRPGRARPTAIRSARPAASTASGAPREGPAAPTGRAAGMAAFRGGPGGPGGPGNPQGPRHPRHGFGGKPPRGPKKH